MPPSVLLFEPSTPADTEEQALDKGALAYTVFGGGMLTELLSENPFVTAASSARNGAPLRSGIVAVYATPAAGQ